MKGLPIPWPMRHFHSYSKKKKKKNLLLFDKVILNYFNVRENGLNSSTRKYALIEKTLTFRLNEEIENYIQF